MNSFKINIISVETEPDREATVANFAIVQKQFNMNWSQIATCNKM